MSWTKRQIVEFAFGELALASYAFDLSPEEMQAGLIRLDTMMGTWQSLGIQVGYNMATGQSDSDLDQDSGLQMNAVEAVYMQLACKIAASKGKGLPSSSTRAAKQAYDSLILNIAKSQVQQQQLATGTPRGQGNKPWRLTNSPFVLRPDIGPLKTDTNGGLDFTGLGN